MSGIHSIIIGIHVLHAVPCNSAPLLHFLLTPLYFVAVHHRLIEFSNVFISLPNILIGNCTEIIPVS